MLLIINIKYFAVETKTTVPAWLEKAKENGRLAQK